MGVHVYQTDERAVRRAVILERESNIKNLFDRVYSKKAILLAECLNKALKAIRLL